jgi:triosephosphate isomerase (TIM)
MKRKLIVANWKSNKTESEAKNWLSAISSFKGQNLQNKEIIVCPSYIHLPTMKAFIERQMLPIKLGAQSISSFSEGAYTGEINGKQIKELVGYALVGHSERRKYLHETNDDVIAKLKQLIINDITPILCVSDMKQMDYYLLKDTVIGDKADDIVFVYEPPNAISSKGKFHAESPEMVNQNAGQISQKIGKKVTTLYGGSVNLANSNLFFTLSNIDGCLVGQASLDAKEFYAIIKNA